MKHIYQVRIIYSHRFSIKTIHMVLSTLNNGYFLKAKLNQRIIMLICVLMLSFSTNGQYCISGATYNGDEDITRVKFGNTLNNASACGSLVGSQGVAIGTADRYSDFALNVPCSEVMVGNTYPIEVQITQCSGVSNYHTVRVFIDFNQNGILSDSGEEFNIFPYANSNTHQIISNITIPPGATFGNTRMRIVCREYNNPGSCTSSSWGETEDYTIRIVPGTPASVVSSTVTQVVSGSVSSCAVNHPMICVPVVVGSGTPIVVTQFVLGAGVTTDMQNDVVKIHIYYTGTTNQFYPGIGNEFEVGGFTPVGAVNAINGSQVLVSNATNYFWIAYDINGPIGDLIDGACMQITVGGVNYVPTVTDPDGNGSLVNCSCAFTLGPSVHICSPNTHTINGPAGFATYLWSPGGQTTQDITVDTSGTYTCTATINSSNLVINGGFGAGNIGFASNYNGYPISGMWGLLSSPSTYAITTNPQLVHNHFYSFGDHTTGAGKMMVCNGSDVANTVVWEQTIATSPNTNYNFSAWVASVMDQPFGSEAQLQFSINGYLIGPVHNAPLIGGIWSNFVVDWYSGANVSATIKIVNQCLSGSSNDFAIDDISFNSFCTESNSVTVFINSPIFPTFEEVDSYCSGAEIPALPTISTNDITGVWTPIINNTATTVYTFTPIAGQCARDTSLIIEIIPKELPVFATVGPYCSGSIVPELVTTSINGISGSWSPSIDNTATTVYTFTPVTGQCATNANLTVTIDSNITPIFTQIGPFCAGTTFSTLPSMSINGYAGTWSPVINNSVTTTYLFTPIVGQCVEFATQTIEILNNEIPEILVNDTLLCFGSSPFSLNASNDGGNWIGDGVFDSISGYFDPSLAGVGDHIVFYQLNSQCGGRDSVTISVEKMPTAVILGDSVRSICEGESVILEGYSDVACHWSTGDNTPVISVSMGGEYVLMSSNMCGMALDTVQVNEHVNPTIDIGSDTALCLMRGLTIAVPDIFHSYQWSNGEITNALKIQHQGNYTLTVTNEFGCKASDQIYVRDSCDNYIYIPNAFTPEGDDLNNEFKPKGINVVDFNMKIFDRWGKVVFQTFDINVGWNGRDESGCLYPFGTYICYIEYSISTSEFNIINRYYLGTVSII